MRPGENGEVIFEGALEARVVAQALTDSNRSALLNTINPPIEPPSIGCFRFLAMLGQDQNGVVDTTEYVCKPPASEQVLNVLAEAAKPFPLDQPTIRRNEYLFQRLMPYAQTRIEQALEKRTPLHTAEIGGVTIFAVNDQELNLLKRREAFVNSFLDERGWGRDASELSTEQILEIRAQPGWKNPPEIS